MTAVVLVRSQLRQRRKKLLEKKARSMSLGTLRSLKTTQVVKPLGASILSQRQTGQVIITHIYFRIFHVTDR